VSRKKQRSRRRSGFEVLTASPGAHDLYNLVHRCERLRKQVRRFLRTHPRECRCVCCCYLRDQVNNPTAKNHLECLDCTLYSVIGWLDCDRPHTDRECERGRPRPSGSCYRDELMLTSTDADWML
jgi:hypothetical protein